ncbi:MAG: hypothetical protein GY842_28505, partial [bacterium]|nr:hypothetical protein [bacterium]
PEVGSGNYHRGIDIYALGVMLYEMLLGKVPYEGSSMGEVLMKHLTAQPEVDQLPAPFGEVIRKALAKDPKDRYQTVDEMAEDLLAVDSVQDSLVGFRPTSLSVAAQRAVGPAETPRRSPNPPPPPPIPGQAPMRGGAVGVQGAFRDFADAAGDALKAAAAGVPYGTPAGQNPRLSPEAASGRLRYGGFWIRFAAAFIDIIIVGLVGRLFGGDPATGVLMILYHGFLVGAWNGQTIGKRACGIKIISADGHPCSMGQAFGRALAEILSFLTLLIGYLMVPFDSRKRGLHDHIASTLVVYALDPDPAAFGAHETPEV